MYGVVWFWAAYYRRLTNGKTAHLVDARLFGSGWSCVYWPVAPVKDGGVGQVDAGGGTLGAAVFAVPAGASFAFAFTVEFPLASVS